MTAPAKRSPYAALKYPAFTAYISAHLSITMALLVQEVALGYSIYKWTHDPLSLGLLGLAEALPYIAVVLFGGHFADRWNKKRIMLLGLGAIIAGSLVLIPVTSQDLGLPQGTVLAVIYGVIMLIGFAKGFFNPASGALPAFLVPKEVFPNATTWQSSFWQAGTILGPGISGFLYAYFGLGITLWCVVGLLAVAALLITTIPAPPVPQRPEVDVDLFASLREGITFVFRTRPILYAISLDLFSVLFGGVLALLPVFTEDVLHVGAEGLGILRAAPSAGAVLTMLAMIHYPPTGKPWRNLLLAVAGFGAATLVFALSRNIWLSAAALFLTGAFDSVSVIIRQTVIYLFTPDHMRGRVSSVNGIFVSSSNELGAFESGVAAKLLGTVPSVVLGGVMTLLTVSIVWLRSKELFGLRFEGHSHERNA
ncbi:MAG: MFS transporter [Flavobacteriales bacterium]